MEDGTRSADLAPLVRAAQRGDPRAFETLVTRFREPLSAYAYALLRDRGLAEDAVQEAFLYAYRCLGTLRRPGAFRTWMYNILENVALTGWRRRRRRRTARFDEGEAVAEGPPRGAARPGSPAGDAPPPPDRPELRAVREAMERIPRTYSEILSLHYLDGMSSSEIAAALGLTRNNAKVRLYRARNALRRDLVERGAAPPERGTPRGEARP